MSGVQNKSTLCQPTTWSVVIPVCQEQDGGTAAPRGNPSKESHDTPVNTQTAPPLDFGLNCSRCPAVARQRPDMAGVYPSPMSLAINTPTGQYHESRGRQLLAAFAEYTRSTLIVTDPTSSAALDAVFYRDGVLVAVAEAKTRVSYDYPAIHRFGSYLVTAEKVDTLCYVGRALAVPAFLVVELSDRMRLYWQLTDANGDQRFLWPEAETRTQATSISPSTVVRKNAYLPIDEAVIWG